MKIPFWTVSLMVLVLCGLFSPIPAFADHIGLSLYVADFDGDGKADRAYLSRDGRWYVASSEFGEGIPSIPWGSTVPGWPGDPKHIAVADFDGDGKADRAYLSPSDGAWYVANTGGGPAVIPWGSTVPGWPGDLSHILIADFDGDGKADRAYLSPSDGAWYVANTGGGPAVIPWGSTVPGWPGDPKRIVVANFDGSKNVQRAYLSPENNWYILPSASSGGVEGFPWGASVNDVDHIGGLLSDSGGIQSGIRKASLLDRSDIEDSVGQRHGIRNVAFLRTSSGGNCRHCTISVVSWCIGGAIGNARGGVKGMAYGCAGGATGAFLDSYLNGGDCKKCLDANRAKQDSHRGDSPGGGGFGRDKDRGNAAGERQEIMDRAGSKFS